MTTQSAAPAQPASSAAPGLLRNRSEKASNIEFWRFIFTVLVCVYHFEIFFVKRNMMLSGSSAVEFFFVLAGFLIAKSAKRDLAGRAGTLTVREAHAKALDFVKKKLKAIYPVLLVVILLWLLVYPSYQQIDKLRAAQNLEWELLLLVGTPFGFNEGLTMNIPMWFLTALIVIGYIYTYAVYKHYDFMMFAAPVIGLLSYVYFALESTQLIDHAVRMGFLNAGMVRAVAEMSLGITLFGLYEYLSKKKIGVIWRIILSLLEIYAVYRFFALMLWQPIGPDNYRRIIYIMILVLLSFLNVTLLAGLLNNRFSRLLGSISPAMYLCHYNLVTVYFLLLGQVKMKLMLRSAKSPLAAGLSDFLQGTGGFDKSYRSIPMSWKDIVLYSLLVIIVSVLIVLLLAAIKRFIVRPVIKQHGERQAEKSKACRSVQEGET